MSFAFCKSAKHGLFCKSNNCCSLGILECLLIFNASQMHKDLHYIPNVWHIHIFYHTVIMATRLGWKNEKSHSSTRTSSPIQYNVTLYLPLENGAMWQYI